MTELLNNKFRITLNSFLAYFLMSAIISPLGLISGPIAAHFGVSLTTATASFTYLTSGIFVGTLIAVFVFDFVNLKQIVVGCAATIGLSIYAVYAIDHFLVFAVALGLIGASCGIELSAAAVVIAKSHAEKLRASMLLLTDSFYSMAGVISTALAGVLLARQLHWSSAYLLAFVVSLCIALIALSADYPATRKQDVERKQHTDKEVWPLGVHAVGLAMLSYLVGFVTIYTWVPNYAQETLQLSAETSGEVVTRFFLGLFVGQLIMFFLVFRLSLSALIFVCASMATLLSASLWMVDTLPQLQIAMLVLGLVSGGLFKTVLTYGTTFVKEPSPKMVSYLIFYAGLGTAIAPVVSSFIVKQYNMAAALQLTTICYAITLLFLSGARWSQSRQNKLSMECVRGGS